MKRLRSPAEIGAAVDRFLASHPKGCVAEASSWVESDPELSSDPDFAADFVAAVEAGVEGSGLEDLTEVLPRGAAVRDRGHLPRDMRPGEELGRFVLVERIARGGMGEVWRAMDRDLDRPVALKLVLPERVSPDSLRRFDREARAGGRLSHPHVVATYDHGENDGVAWIAQELVADACTLRDFLAATGAEPTLPAGHDRAVAELVAKIADGLAAMHDAGIVHRDLKPSNVLISRGDFPKITDFGLARIDHEAALSVSGEVAGTWAYMSPEQVTGSRGGVDHRTDIFSLGVLLYELVARQRPFRGDTSAQIAEKILRDDPAPVRSVRAQCPLDLALICQKALEKQPKDRYQTAAELAADLRRFLAHEPILATPPSRARRAAKWVRRHPTASLATLVGVVAFSITAWFAIENARLLGESKTQEGLARLSAAEARESAAEARAAEKVAAGERVRAEAALGRAEQLLVERDAALAQERERAEQLRRVAGFQRDQLGAIDPAAMGVVLRERLLQMHGDRASSGGNDETPRLFADQLRGLDFTGLSLDVVAESIFADSLASIDARFEGDPRLRVELLQTVAMTMRDVGLLREAWEAQQRALDLLRTLPDGPGVALPDAITKLAMLALNLDQIEASRALSDEARASWGERGVEDLLLRGEADLLSAQIQRRAGDAEGAVKSLRQLQKRSDAQLGPVHPLTMESGAELAKALQDLGSSGEAEAVLRAQLEAASALGPGGASQRASLERSLALVLVAMKRPTDAIPLLEELLDARRLELGDRHPRTIADIQNLAIACLEAGSLDRAAELLSEALDAYADTLGLSNESAFMAANSLGGVLKQQGRFGPAEEAYRKALEGLRVSLGDAHPRTLSVQSNLGLVLVSLDRPAEAVERLRAVLAGFRSLAGDGHPAVLVAMNNLALALKSNGELEEAEQLYRQALAGSQARLGPEHRSTLSAMNNLASLLEETERLEEAEELLRAALAAKRRSLGSEHPSTLTSIQGLASTLARRGSSEEADRLMEEALTGRRRVLGTEHPATVQTMLSLASYLQATERGQDATALLSAWLEATPLPEDDERVASVRAWLAGQK
ncbi:MAG: tetratricopeptide repeat protein [Planctomycetota bacterium]